MTLRATEREGALTFEVRVQPRASRTKVGPVRDGQLRVAVTAPPVEGEANLAVIQLLAELLHVPRSSIQIVNGQSGRRKLVRIEQLSLAALLSAVVPES